ncbi:hypothetical protein [Cypionkella sp.]|uniref:hypothetical protein n=1 Tax=Cypionkella sp. TaxID=2811411 RepID=UPI002ABAF699|nr:hypothetical protein [Cypionkella sp.]MDZ4392506.1 hypothetical protein [Cypionkella sp.]
MKVLVPTIVQPYNWSAYTDSQFFEATAWSAATAYVVGDYVFVAADRSQYICLVANTNFAPISNPAKWARFGASLAWRAFDGFLTTNLFNTWIPSSFDASAMGLWAFPTTIQQSDSKATYTLRAMGAFNSVAVLATECSQVKIYFYDPTGTLGFSRTIRSLDDAQIIDAWDYCFGELSYARDFIFDNLDGWGTSLKSQLYIEISNDPTPSNMITPSVYIGEIVVGQSHDIGGCHADAAIQLIDYSKKEIDPYGTVTIVQRAYSLNGSFEVEIEKSKRLQVQNLITSLRATPAVYYPSEADANQGLVIYGYVKDYSSTYSTPDRAYASLEIEGMI